MREVSSLHPPPHRRGPATAREGACVAALDHDAEAAQGRAEEARAVAPRADATDVGVAVARTHTEVGGLGGLVLGVGIARVQGTSSEVAGAAAFPILQCASYVTAPALVVVGYLTGAS